MDFGDEMPAAEEIAEEHCRCDCCGNSFGTSANEGVNLERGTQSGDAYVSVLSLCIECADAVYKEYRQGLVDAGICEHGESLAKSCPDCLKAHGEAIDLCREIIGFWGSHEAWGDFASLQKAAVAFSPIADRARKILVRAIGPPT
jgi:hypothetical protein